MLFEFAGKVLSDGSPFLLKLCIASLHCGDIALLLPSLSCLFGFIGLCVLIASLLIDVVKYTTYLWEGDLLPW